MNALCKIKVKYLDVIKRSQTPPEQGGGHGFLSRKNSKKIIP